ncbi:MAG: hypothetical protein HOH07_06635 [Euryarchaeota archaeon]|jgi:type IV secretory pathway VirB10-like protein|nr:hypothetical protein [Euryarchaeota archaeon]
MNENLQNLVQLAKDKKATEFKAVLTTEIESRLSSKIAAMKSVLSKTMFSKNSVNESSNEPGEAPSPSSVEHTHDDGTTHSHVNGDEKHVHEGKLPPALQKAVDAKKGKKDDDEDEDEDTKDEGTLPPALQKAIDAKKGKKKDDDEDEDDDDKEQDENIANFGNKKAKPFTDDDNPTDNKKKKVKKESLASRAANFLDEGKVTVQVDYNIDREDPKVHEKLMKKHKVKISKSVYDHGSYQAKVTGDEKNIRAWMSDTPYRKGEPLFDKDYIDDTLEDV